MSDLVLDPQLQTREGRPAPPAEAGERSRSVAERVDLFGPLFVALYFLSTAKWGSYVIPGPPYIGDVMLGVLLTNRVLLVAAGRSSHAGRDVTIAALGLGLLTWTLIRLAFGEFSVNAARDAAPYFYCVFAFLVVPLQQRDEAFATRIIYGFLIFHLIWVTIVMAFGDVPFAPDLPWAVQGGGSSDLHVFHLRKDFDSVVCGAFGVIAIHRALCGHMPITNLLLGSWSLTVAIAAFGARAGFVALLGQLAILVLLAPARRRSRDQVDASVARPRSNAHLVVAILILIFPISAYLAATSPVAEQLPLAIDPGASAFEEGNGADTAQARLRAWERLTDWITSDPGRLGAGTGFGPNYFIETGAARLFSVQEFDEVRAPHNYWINTWARLGTIGLILVLGIWFAAMRLAAIVVGRSADVRVTDLLAIMIALTLPISATFGVLLESPFGAIPWFWAVGHLSVRACQLGGAARFSDLLQNGAASRHSAAPRGLS